MESVVNENENEKLCFDCKTSKTPLWRSGPAGPKSLCNACGIRYRKKSVTTKSDKKKERQDPSPSPSTSSATDDNTRKLRKKLRVKVVAMGMGKEMVMMQGPRSPMKKVKRMGSDEYKYKMMRRKFGEVEEAAYLLMCLSCG